MSMLFTSAQPIEGRLTGKVTNQNVSWSDGLRFIERDGQRILQQRWECSEFDYDNESSRQWKEWRDVPLVQETADEPDGADNEGTE